MNIIELLKNKKKLNQMRKEKKIKNKSIKTNGFLAKEDKTYGFFKKNQKSENFDIDNIVRKYESLGTNNFDDKKFTNFKNNYDTLDENKEIENNNGYTDYLNIDNNYKSLNEYNISNISEKSSDDVNII